MSAFEVDPLENLIGFYSVVGSKRNLDDNDNSMISASVAGTNARTNGVVSQLNVRSSDMTSSKHTVQQHMRNVTKKSKGQMASAGSGSESAVMIKAIARGENRGENTHTDASCSSRLGTANQ